ncbi:membrane hypothetical protein [Desulfovibrionales bacterium]
MGGVVLYVYLYFFVGSERLTSGWVTGYTPVGVVFNNFSLLRFTPLVFFYAVSITEAPLSCVTYCMIACVYSHPHKRSSLAVVLLKALVFYGFYIHNFPFNDHTNVMTGLAAA